MTNRLWNAWQCLMGRAIVANVRAYNEIRIDLQPPRKLIISGCRIDSKPPGIAIDHGSGQGAEHG